MFRDTQRPLIDYPGAHDGCNHCAVPEEIKVRHENFLAKYSDVSKPSDLGAQTNHGVLLQSFTLKVCLPNNCGWWETKPMNKQLLQDRLQEIEK